MDEKLYCIQDTRSYIGDSVVWWRVGGRGYTYDIDQAWIVGESEARRIESIRGTDKAWPVELVEASIVRSVDISLLRGKQ
jgi:hypothetical protein